MTIEGEHTNVATLVVVPMYVIYVAVTRVNHTYTNDQHTCYRERDSSALTETLNRGAIEDMFSQLLAFVPLHEGRYLENGGKCMKAFSQATAYLPDPGML